MKLDFPVMVAALLIAAALQELLPAISCGPVQCKVQLLPAVALYYIFHRQWQLALFAALWAGILTDALGMLPRGTTSGALFAYALAAVALRDSPSVGNSPSAVLVFMRALPLLACIFAIQGLRIPAAIKGDWLTSAGAFLRTAPLAALAAVPVSRILRCADVFTGNIDLFGKEDAA